MAGQGWSELGEAYIRLRNIVIGAAIVGAVVAGVIIYKLVV